jgi:ABC-2 type transport system ATP-binding protein
LDPEGRDEMLELVRDVSHEKGVNVVVSSHLMPDIERTCDQVVVMKGGAVAAQGEVSALRDAGQSLFEVTLREPSPTFAQALRSLGAEIPQEVGDTLRVRLPDAASEPGPLFFSAARSAGAQVRGYRPAQRSLSEVFLEALTAK